ncbi:CAP domain-containing protein [Sphingomonas jatrophae]|uniref:Cysteine-rich secretory protein family protein n=1 Tax=Sphingomonas jatrophae TaxID=1166337 RepID=A0A1I6JHF0_9SPHN|nr:CAP domain-containing protein [Sphingomonas jatrophae]SFR78437.1 Cysteine-rich secretory protein family protein [Sphingomonas jatrophae]
MASGNVGRKLAAAVVLVVLTTAAAPVRLIEWRTAWPQAPRAPETMRSAMLEGHNRARAELGQPALEWDERLARDADAYALDLARTNRFEHAAQDGWNPQGENLWRGTRGAFRFEEMVGHWISERRNWKRGRTPDFSLTGQWGDVGHYTQIVWRGTKRVGCGIATGAQADVLVCRYWPAGNVMGVDGLTS